MRYTLVRSVDALVEPVTAREATTHLRLDASNTEPTPLSLTAALGVVAGNLSAGVYRYRVTFVTPDGETDGGEISAPVTVANPAVAGQVALTNIPIGGGAVTGRRIWRTAAGGSTFLLLQLINDNTTTLLTDNTADVALGGSCPTTNTTVDPELYRLIRAAREVSENYCKRAFIEQTWQQRQGAFPDRGTPLILWKPNLISVTQVVYLDEAGVSQILSSSVYELDTQSLPPRLHEKIDQEWPSTYTERHNTVLTEFKAGYGASRANVPDAIRQAILIHVGDLYAHRESFVTGTIAQDLSFSARNLLAPYRWWEV